MSDKSSIAGVPLGIAVLSRNTVTGVPRLTVTRGNRKIHPSIAIWSLPPPLTCPGAGICLLFCYFFKVLKGLRGIVLAAVNSNFKASLRDDFVDRMVDKLLRMKGIVGVRVHGGDFYCDAYIRKWEEVARRLPHLKFFAFTKSLHLNLAPLEQLPNFTVIKSFGGLLDRRISRTSDNYAVVVEDVQQAKKQAKLAGGRVCPPELLA